MNVRFSLRRPLLNIFLLLLLRLRLRLLVLVYQRKSPVALVETLLWRHVKRAAIILNFRAVALH